MEEKPQPVRIQLLGGFRVSVGSRTVGESGWRLKKAKNVVKLLALSPAHRMHREQVMDLLWPDSSDPKSQANNLRQALHSARRALGVQPAPASAGASSNDYLRLLEDQVSLCPEGNLWVDVEAFEAAAATARRVREPAAYQAAIDLYAGELLPEDRYEEWAQERRESLRTTYLSLLVELAVLDEEREEFEGAIEALRKAVEAEPTHEEAHAELMRLYSLTGRRHEALLQYEQLRKALSEGLGAETGEPGRLLFEEIRAGRAPTSGPTSGLRTQALSGNGGTRYEPSHSARHNLPTERTSFVGREEEMVEVQRLLSMTDLLTLTGAGGSGKTRLALEVARGLAGTYPDGVWLVELAPLSDPELVERTVASALGVREQPGRPLSATLKEHLYSTKLLVVMDNCEHLIESTAGLVEMLLDSCPNLKVLATSREALNISGELIWPVSSLSVPDESRSPSPMVEELARYESVRLFVERARYRRPSFELTPENAGMVAEVCERLEGIPLAIELAAARIGVLSVGQVAARLKDSLQLLAGDSRTAPSRQRTLRGALEWSYELLGELECDLFGRLSVFWGSWSLDAAEAVGVGSGIEEKDVLDLLGRLVDKSLVAVEVRGAEELRYRMLEPVRQYGQERLEKSGEAEAVRYRHAAWFLALAEEAEPELRGAGQEAWLERLKREHDNLRAALSWTHERGEAELELRLSGALGEFWYLSGHLSEGRRWLEAALANEADGPEAARARALIWAGSMRWITREHDEYERLVVLSEEGLALSRKLGDQTEIALALLTLGYAEIQRNELERASALAEEAITLQRASADTASIARSLPILGFVALSRHDYDRAIELHEESLALAREAGEGFAIVVSLIQGALAYSGRGEHRRARALCEEGLGLAWQLKMMPLLAGHLHVSAVLAGSQGQAVRSARLWGAAEALRETLDISLSPIEHSHYDPYIAIARSQLNETAWEAAWSEGRKMTPEQALEYALSGEEETLTRKAPAVPEESPAAGGRHPGILTRREREVAMLVAQEMSNRRIAEELVISERTVATHVHKILKKLNLRSRLQIAAWAMEQELLQ